MARNGTERETGGLPVALAAAAPRPSLVRIATNADFLSQLIAERQHLPPQRERRQVPVEQAVNAYVTGARITVRRMPAGYRTTIVA